MNLAANNLYLCTTCFELSSHGFTTQRCDCEGHQKSEGVDCPSGIHLCFICQSRLAGGTSRWSWEACNVCLAANKTLEADGYPPLPLGRHSVMNGLAISMTASKQEQEIATQGFLAFVSFVQELQRWSISETQKKYLEIGKWANLKQVPMALWIKEFGSAPVQKAIPGSIERLKEVLTVLVR